MPKHTRYSFERPAFSYFDPAEPIGNLSGNLPHWRQAGTIYFVTYRLADSVPQTMLRQWQDDRAAWLRRNPPPHTLDQRLDYYNRFPARFQEWLDQGYGECVLRHDSYRDLVAQALRHFEGTRYALDEWIVMPNHVHVLVTPTGGHELSSILRSWKSYTANQINRHLGRGGPLWQKESFDHIVRNSDSLERIRKYIRENGAT